MGVADEAGFITVAEQRLKHSQRQQLGVRQLRRDPDLRAKRNQFGSGDQDVVDHHVQFGRESVQIGVHARSSRIRVCSTPPILGALARYVVDGRALRDPLELTI